MPYNQGLDHVLESLKLRYWELDEADRNKDIFRAPYLERIDAPELMPAASKLREIQLALDAVNAEVKALGYRHEFTIDVSIRQSTATLDEFVAKYPAPYRSPWQLRLDGTARMRVSYCDLHICPKDDVAYVDSPNSVTEDRYGAPKHLSMIDRIGWFFARIMIQEPDQIDFDHIPKWAQDATKTAFKARREASNANPQ